VQRLASAREQRQIRVVQVLEETRVKNYASSVYVLKTHISRHFECSARLLENVTLEEKHL